jgi:hypothetical protein
VGKFLHSISSKNSFFGYRVEEGKTETCLKVEGKRCTCVKDWFKPTRPLRELEFLMTMVGLAPSR